MHLLTYQDDRGQNLTQVPLLCNSCNVNLDILFAHFVREVKNLKSLPNFDTIGDNIRCCVHVRSSINAWQLSMKQQSEQIPTFDKFL